MARVSAAYHGWSDGPCAYHGRSDGPCAYRGWSDGPCRGRSEALALGWPWLVTTWVAGILPRGETSVCPARRS
ncbi:hypothetical protein Pyn_01964 [Prunus yedoensis var. nudiflora]|uniref:Uncharacterized protein n=1 Tax=Prunus yedoensis var. nudiflora TaxID=2094558 RepID=A0A314XRA1_PRUYE|nr:hypothetical protein Pyn_01964 [Prunus yedoensis var. nudiflora]